MLRKIWTYFLYLIAKGIVGVRYRVRIKGLERLNAETLKRPGGILFLPNHPAEIDPVLIVLAFWLRFRPRPIVVETFFYLSGVHFLMKVINALPVPDLDGTVNKWKQKKIEKLFALVSERLKAGDNFLIYPSGKLKVTGAEILGGASFVHNLLKECPEVNLVFIRTTGLWGSRFSRAITGATPNLGSVIWNGVKIVLRNLIFFTPKRDVLVEVETPPADFPYTGSRLEVNQYLEKWYNVNGPEPLKLVSDLFWKVRYPIVYTPKKAKEEGSIAVLPEIQKEVFDKIAEIARRGPEGFSPQMHLARDLGLDSLDVAQIYVFLDDKYEVEGLLPGDLQTIEDVLRVATGLRKNLSHPSTEKRPANLKWPSESSRPAIAPPMGKTIGEAFLLSCDRMDNHVASGDALSGPMTYRKWRLSALILSRKIRQLEGKYIGILLPSSSAVYLCIFATILAKKIPVMLNWTVGVRSLDHAADLTGMKHVLSSRRFLNNLNNSELGKIDDLLLLLEDLREEISFGQKCAGFFDLLKNTKTLLKDLGLDQVSENDPAVVLFTSGTESLPKGVPLTHRNLLSNQAASLACFDFKAGDIFYGVLPPFHSFGFSLMGILPILTGLKIYYAPDPTNTHGMATDIATWKPTVFCCAPTFIQGVFRVAEPVQLSSLRYVLSGAEKAPAEIAEYVAAHLPGAKMLEGYGITECSPVVTIQRPGKAQVGVGQAIPGVELCLVDIEQGEGEVCIHGPNVFSGYLGDQKSPFVELEGKTWYRSGDRGHIDSEGNLILSGRLKRFVKVGGEMVSLSGLETEVLRLAAEKKWPIPADLEGPAVAIGVKERDSGRPLIVLFTVFPISKDEVNEALRDSGYGRIVKIAEVRKLDQIPVTATGKVQYSAIDEIV